MRFSFRHWPILAALAAALVSFIVQYFAIFRTDHDFPRGVKAYVAVVLALLWIVLTAFSVQRYGRQGLWPLLAAPFALLTPLLMMLLAASCALNSASCP
jgi:uncharacterized membrane protein